MGGASGGRVPGRVLGLGDFGCPDGASPGYVGPEDLAAIVQQVHLAVDRGECLIAVCGQAEAATVRRSVHLARTAEAGAPVALHVSPLPPLGRHLLLSMADALAGELGAGELVAALHALEDRLLVLAVLGGVSRLERPSPSLGQHIASWWRTTSFVVQAWPVGGVHRLRRDRQALSADPGDICPGLPAAAAERVRVTAGGGHRSGPAAEALLAALAADRTVEHEPSTQARRWWGTEDAVEVCLAPLNLADTAQAARELCAPCPWCGEPAPAPRCPMCGHLTAPPVNPAAPVPAIPIPPLAAAGQSIPGGIQP